MSNFDFANFVGYPIYVYKNGSQIGSFNYPGSKVFDFQDSDRIKIGVDAQDLATAQGYGYVPSSIFYAQNLPRYNLGETGNGVLIGPPSDEQGGSNKVNKTISTFNDGSSSINTINTQPSILILKNNSSQYTIGMFKDSDWYALPINPGVNKWSMVGGYKGAGMAHSYSNNQPKLIDVGGIVQNNKIFDLNGTSYDIINVSGSNPQGTHYNEYGQPSSVTVQSTYEDENFWEIEYAKGYWVLCDTSSAGAFLKFSY